MLFLYGSLKLEKVVKICIQQRKPDSGTVNVQLSEEKTHQSDTKMSHKLKVSNKTRMTFQATGRAGLFVFPIWALSMRSLPNKICF